MPFCIKQVFNDRHYSKIFVQLFALLVALFIPFRASQTPIHSAYRSVCRLSQSQLLQYYLLVRQEMYTHGHTDAMIVGAHMYLPIVLLGVWSMLTPTGKNYSE